MLTYAVAGLSGFLMKFYDDIVDNPEAYSGLYKDKLVLEIVMIACVTYFAHLDPIALIACIITVLVDIMIYTYNLFYPVLNLNYAIDKTSWKNRYLPYFSTIYLQGFVYLSIIYNIRLCDYYIGIWCHFLDAISLVSKDKKVTEDPYANMIHLEASNRKITITSLCPFWKYRMRDWCSNHSHLL